MSSRIRKILKHTVIAVLSLAVLFLVLNLFLTGRLERYLKRELIERTANATDGFYDGFVDYNKNGRQDKGEGVIVWRGSYGLNGHATTYLDMSKWQTAKS